MCVYLLFSSINFKNRLMYLKISKSIPLLEAEQPCREVSKAQMVPACLKLNYHKSCCLFRLRVVK